MKYKYRILICKCNIVSLKKNKEKNKRINLISKKTVVGLFCRFRERKMAKKLACTE